MNKQCIELIKRFEGCKLAAYRCPAGVWTIGYGHTVGVKPGDVITQEDAERLLEEDVAAIARCVDAATGCKIKGNKRAALVSFAYNVGIAAFRRSTLLAKVLSDSNDASIRCEFLRWVYAGGTKVVGLVNRRTAEAELYFK